MASYYSSRDSKGYILRLDVNETETSISGNYSKVSWALYIESNTGYYFQASYNNVSVNVDGNVYSNGNVYIEMPSGYTSTLICNGNKTIYHDSDGSKTINISASYSAGWAAYYMPSNLSLSTSVSLTTIPRASAVACSSPYIGDVAIITIDKKTSEFTSTITYKIDSLTATIAEKTQETVLSFDTSTLTSSIYELIPNTRSIEGTIYCTTYNGDTQIGNIQSTTFNLYAKDDVCKPTVSGVVVDTNQNTINLTGDSSIIVKNVSRPKVTITATPKYSSTISSYLINLNDGQTSIEQECIFNTINSNSITIDATDSREYNNPATIDISNRVIDYVKLHFNSIDLRRPESTSNQVFLSANGVWFNGAFSLLNSNILFCSFQYKKSTDNSWTNGGTINPTILNNTFTFNNVSLGNNFDYNYEYQFKIIATDLLMTVGDDNKDAQTVPKGIAVVEIGDESVNINGTFTVNDSPVSSDPLSVYPVGSLYLSVSATNPSTLFGGTWQQITNDAYLKIVSSNAGDLGGTSSEHKIPISSMPSHTHTQNSHRHTSYKTWAISAGSGTSSYVSGNHTDGFSGSDNYTDYATATNQNTGGGQAYYPYYYGIYVWVRTA